MTENIFEIVFRIFGPLSVISIFAIGFYLYRRNLFTAWQLRTAFFWPELIIKYREHTRKTRGQTGIWFYLCIISIILSVMSIVGLLVVQVILPVLQTSGNK